MELSAAQALRRVADAALIAVCPASRPKKAVALACSSFSAGRRRQRLLGVDEVADLLLPRGKG